MSYEAEITREDLDKYLRDLGKEFRRLNRKKMPAEIVIIGGASVLINYAFRDVTTDVDAIIQASSAMQDAINRVSDKYGLPYGWLNTDFRKTDSYTPKLLQYSSYYRTYSNILSVRTVKGEYLVAMKVRSGRNYKYDMSDIVSILRAHEEAGSPLTYEQIDIAMNNLYGGWENAAENVVAFLKNTLASGNYDELYLHSREEEIFNRANKFSQIKESLPDDVYHAGPAGDSEAGEPEMADLATILARIEELERR
ncbi:hypothetical protein AGMMS49983_04670 [Clostridia bacterium]|nr:hypothetical protein AGMMS49983_04670 [Clostridia bacterium]